MRANHSPIFHRRAGLDLWECINCGHEILSIGHPGILRWKDGHVCRFKKVPFPDIEEEEDE